MGRRLILFAFAAGLACAAAENESQKIFEAIARPTSTRESSTRVVREEALTRLASFVAEHGLPAEIPAEVIEFIRSDVKNADIQRLNDRAELVALLKLRDENLTQNIFDAYLLNRIFTSEDNRPVRSEDLAKESSTLVTLMQPMRSQSSVDRLFHLMQTWASARATYKYKLASLPRGGVARRQSYETVANAWNEMNLFLTSFRSAIQPQLETILFSAPASDLKSFYRALELARFLNLKSNKLADRYLQILETPLPQGKPGSRVRDAAIANLLSLITGDDSVIVRLRQIPPSVWGADTTRRSVLYFQSAKLGSATAIEALAEEILAEMSQAGAAKESFEHSLDDPFGKLSQFNWSPQTEATVDKILAVSDSGLSSELKARKPLLRERRSHSIQATGDLNDPAVVQRFLGSSGKNEVALNQLLLQRNADAFGVPPGDLEVERRIEVGLLLKTTIESRLNPKPLDGPSLGAAILALRAIGYSRLAQDAEVQLMVAKLTHFPRPDLASDYAIETASISRLAIEVLAGLPPGELQEASLVELTKRIDNELAQKVISRTHTQAASVQRALIEMLKVEPKFGFAADNREQAMVVLNELTIVNGEVKSELRRIFERNKDLRKLALSVGKKTLVDAGLMTDPSAMATIAQITAHLQSHPGDRLYFESLIEQSRRGQKFSNDDLRPAVQTVLRDYLRHPQLNREEGLEKLTNAIDFATRLEMFDTQTVALIAPWAKKSSLGIVSRLRMGLFATTLRNQASEFMRQAGTRELRPTTNRPQNAQADCELLLNHLATPDHS